MSWRRCTRWVWGSVLGRLVGLKAIRQVTMGGQQLVGMSGWGMSGGDALGQRGQHVDGGVACTRSVWDSASAGRELV